MLSLVKPQLEYPSDYQDGPGQHPFGHPIHLGVYTDPQRRFGFYGELEQATLDLSEGSAVFAGPIGTGRTNILHLVMADVVFWPNTVLMAVDPIGGLVTPWMKGAGRDVFARVAADEESALDTIGHLQRILRLRQQTLAASAMAHDEPWLTPGDGKTPCTECGTPHPQAIVLLVDDGILRRTHLEQILELIRTARLWAIRVVLVSQHGGGAGGTIPRELLLTAKTVGVLPTWHREEQEYLLNVHRLPGMPTRRGEGFIKTYGQPARQIQFDRMRMEKAIQIAEVAGLNDPVQLADVEAELGGESFHRWQEHPATEWILQDCR